MTETAERAGEHVRRVRTVRMHDGTWDLLQSRRGMIAATLINDMTEAGLGFVRCRICHEPVPVEFGDLTGRPLAEWIDVTGKAIKTQHRDGHHPVTIGNGTPAASPEPGKAGGGVLTPRFVPAPAPPGAESAAVPGAAGSKNKKGQPVR